MIPVITIDKEGNLSNQVFNDNLTAVEQINRTVLGTIAYTQTKLTNVKNAFDQNFDSNNYNDEQLNKVKGASLKLQKAVVDAIYAFNKAVADPNSVE